MSFSQEVKEELSRHIPGARHCQLAELAALVSFLCKLTTKGKETALILETESPLIARKYFTLLNKTLSIYKDKKVITDQQALELLTALKMWRENERGETVCRLDVVDGILLQQTCCKRAFIRGAFLAAGSISDPRKAYHMEIVCRTSPQARQLRDVMNTFEAEAKIVERKGHYVVYVKEGSRIVDMRGVMEASVALMNLENVRILKEMRNSVNRKVNCETANIGKTVSAAVRQVEDIQLIEKKIGLSKLPQSLQEIARVRLEHPDMPLKDLGELLTPPVGKSGVNHRLRRISEIAEKLKV
mgnify:FL=1